MNTNTTTQGAAAGSAGFALAVASIVIWLLSLKNVSVPADVATAFVTLISVGTHFVVTLLAPKNQDINVPIPAATVDAVIVPTTAVPMPPRDLYAVTSNTSLPPPPIPAGPDDRNRPSGH